MHEILSHPVWQVLFPIVTLALAFVGAYVGVRVAVTEVRAKSLELEKRLDRLERQADDASRERDNIWSEVSDLGQRVARIEGPKV